MVWLSRTNRRGALYYNLHKETAACLVQELANLEGTKLFSLREGGILCALDDDASTFSDTTHSTASLSQMTQELDDMDYGADLADSSWFEPHVEEVSHVLALPDDNGDDDQMWEDAPSLQHVVDDTKEWFRKRAVSITRLFDSEKFLQEAYTADAEDPSDTGSDACEQCRIAAISEDDDAWFQHMMMRMW